MTERYDVSPEDHAEYLATRWASVKQLEEAGIPCRKGPFTKQEIWKLQAALDMYQKENNLDGEKLDDLIHSSRFVNGFWSHIARAVPSRGVKSVFYHVRRARDSTANAGKWCSAEDEQLQKAVQRHGRDWVAVADLVQRPPADCSDRFRQYVQYQGNTRKGVWSSDEEDQLIHAMEEFARQGKSDISSRRFWVAVSEAMRGTRTPKQCQSKWSDTLKVKAKNPDRIRRWKHEDNYILIFKIASLDLDDESDVDWKSLNDSAWDMWSGRRLQQKWKSLKVKVNRNAADDTMSHRESVNRLVSWVSETGQLPTPPTT